MSNRPFSSSSSNRDRSSEYDFDFGQDINPALPGSSSGQQSTDYPGLPAMPRRSNQRTCLILFGVFFACICVCCVFLGTSMAMQREETLVMLWLDWVSPSGQSPLTLDDVVEDVDQAEEVGLLCENSQATEFTRHFFEVYGDQDLSITDYRLSSQDGEVRVTGSWQLNSGEVLDYEAVFSLDTSLTGYLGFMGCIEEIRQVSPPFDLETEPDTPRIFGG